MKYLVSFISNRNRSHTNKKSNYELIICESHSPDISGMITLNKCLVLRKTWGLEYRYSPVFNNIPKDFEVSFPYREEEETIIVNREDISEITSIKDEEVDKYIPNISFGEANIKTNEEIEKSKIEAQKQMDEYNANKPIDMTSNINEIPKNINNWFTKLIKRSKV